MIMGVAVGMAAGGPSADVQNLLVELVDHLDAMVAYWDTNQVCVFANAAYREWFGKGRSQLLGTTMKELLGPLYEKNLPYIEAAFRGEKQVFEREIPMPGGGTRASLATYVPRVVDGVVQGIFVHVADVSSLKELERALIAAKELAEARATHDTLTGLANRALLNEVVDKAILASRRSGRMLALMSVDVDNFKLVNDTHGHAEGDRFLVEMANRMTRSVRDLDTVLRLGGDEFVVACPDVGGPAEARSLADRLLAAASPPFLAGTCSMSPSLSVGIAMHPLHGETTEALLAASDQALYAAKRAGRGRHALAATEGRSPAV
jgi:diguanylate cyclase (GGDEF)-like protein/PAS domain S-box-containing protein